jgi:Lrp/AsnC family leucine-responsive transcriptional regulator
VRAERVLRAAVSAGVAMTESSPACRRANSGDRRHIRGYGGWIGGDGQPSPKLLSMLDQTGRRIVAELQADARLSLAELGRRVNLSPPAVAERVQRLERAGVITGYHAAVDPKALGYAVAAVVRVAPATRQLERIRQLARDTPEVVECHRITGEDCFFLKLHLRSIDELEDVLDRFTPYGRTTTSIIHSSPVDRRPLPLERPGDA